MFNFSLPQSDVGSTKKDGGYKQYDPSSFVP